MVEKCVVKSGSQVMLLVVSKTRTDELNEDEAIHRPSKLLR